MADIILRIYDYMRRHTPMCVTTLCVSTALLILLVSRVRFNEDISAFLPLGEQYQESLQVYQDVSGASKLLAIFQMEDTTQTDEDALVCAMNDFGEYLSAADTSGIIREVTAQVDYDGISAVTDFVYQHIPLFLTENDYTRMDSLLAVPDYTGKQLQEDLTMLMYPTSGLLSANLQRDPLNLFTPVVSELMGSWGADGFQLYDGYIFTHDMKRSLMALTSPYGNSETHNNARLMQMLDAVADSVQAHSPAVSVRYIGGPSIAVGNSTQIRQDSILSVSLAVILILALLYYAFRSLRNILLVVLSISWGWLFALGLLSLFHQNISLIVVGISSIIVGIAVNYPLHLIAHASHTRDTRQALSEIISPLIIGNITTVGAFCALIPLQAAALRDLGIFSALLLIGTILFVILWLPHIIHIKASQQSPRTPLLDWIGNIRLEEKKRLVVLIGILTLVFGWFSLRTGFDVDMSHINYMTASQRSDMEYLRQLTEGSSQGHRSIYVVSKGSSMEEAMDNSLQIQDKLRNVAERFSGTSLSSSERFLCSMAEQSNRIHRWERFVSEHSHLLGQQLTQEATAAGFSADAFDNFHKITSRQYQAQDFPFFKPLQHVYASHLSTDSLSGCYRIINIITVPVTSTDSVSQAISAVLPSTSFCFDIGGLNSTLANNLTDNFNYVGWACALIVFLFLWFSFGNIRLALLSFMPMAVSWIWILGIMGLLDIQFNIVNVILATFIFGQGDDYTIFMTEGCLYERTHGRKMLAAHKRSIALSALIMFIGIGTLIFARHPALRSLAEVTIVGMFSVVLMAYVIPPLFLASRPKKS